MLDPADAPDERSTVLGQATGRPTWVRWRIVALLATFSFMTYFNRVSISVVSTDIIKQFGITETEMGWIMSSLLLTYTIFMTPGGWLSDQWGPRAALMLMGFGSAAFTALTALAGHPALIAALILPSFMLVRGLMGVFTAPIFPASGRMISNWIPLRKQASANSLVNCAAPLGAACVQAVFPILVVYFESWRWAFVAAAVVTAGFTAWWMWYANDDPRRHVATNEAEVRFIASHTVSPDVATRSRRPTQWRALLRNRSLLLLTLSYTALGYLEYIFFYWTTHYFREIRHLSREEAALAATLPNLAMMLFTPIGGWISDRLVQSFGYRRGRCIVPIAGMILSASSLMVAANTASIGLMLCSFTLAQGFAGATEGPFWATAFQLGRRDGGTAGGLVNTGGNAGGFLAPIVTPWVSGIFGSWRWGLNLGAIVCLAGVAAWFFIDPEESSQESSDAVGRA